MTPRGVPRLAMTIGPTRFAESVLARVAEPPLPITEPVFIATLARCCGRLRVLMGEPSGSQLIIPATGTMGMEMAAANFVPPASRVVVACTGSWGDRWASVAERLGLFITRVTPPPGLPVDLGVLETAVRRDRPTAVFLTHIDSSTGVSADVAAVGRIAGRYEARLIVDGICAAGAERIDQSGWGVSVYLASTPKAIGAPAGLVLLSLSPDTAAELRRRTWVPPSYSLDLGPWLEVFTAAEDFRFQYFQSPAGNLVGGLDESLRLIEEEGLPARYERHARCARSLHKGLAAIGAVVFARSDARSTAVTVCRYPSGQGPHMLARLREMGLVLPAGTHPAVANQTFRIGHLGNVRMNDIEFTLECLAHVCGLPASGLSVDAVPHGTNP